MLAILPKTLRCAHASQNDTARFVRKLSSRALFCAALAMSGLARGQTSSTTLTEFGKLPLSFEANMGQTAAEARFTSHGNGYSLFLTDNAAVITLSRSPSGENVIGKADISTKCSAEANTSNNLAGERITQDIITMQLVGAKAHPHVEGAEQLPGKANYLIGNDPSQWRTNVPTYARVRYTEVYPGIDLAYYGRDRQLEYDLVIAPGANPNLVRLRFSGAEQLRMNSVGDLVIGLQGQEMVLKKPFVYQDSHGIHKKVSGHFILSSNGDVRFKIGTYDHSRELVIDPVMVYSTYLGGANSDKALALAVDNTGSAYIAGTTNSTDFPVTQGSYTTVYSGAPSFVAKLNASGTGLVYSTYLNGTGGTAQINALAVDAAGDAYVTGYTNELNYPVTSGVYQARNNGSLTTFITKLNPAGTALLASTYLGGSSGDTATAIALDTSGNVYVSGYTQSKDFPITSGAVQTAIKTIYQTNYVAKLNPALSSLIYGTFLGGSASQQPYGISVDTAGNAFVAGTTTSTDFPTSSGAYQFNNKTGGGRNAGFISKLNASGTGLLYSTYLSGTFSDTTSGIAVDSSGDAYVAGFADSLDFPTTSGAYKSGSYGPFVAKLNPTGTGLVYSTIVDLNTSSAITSITLDPAGNAYLVGTTGNRLFPVTSNALQATAASSAAGFVMVLNSTGSGLQYSSYLAGTTADYPAAVALDSSGNVYVTGSTLSSDFPTTTGAFQTQIKSKGSYDAFVTKLNVGTTSVAAAAPVFSPTQGPYSSATAVTITDTTPGNTIYYTTGSSTPTTSSTKYTGPITVTATTTINAIAVASGYTNSPVTSATYTISSGKTAPLVSLTLSSSTITTAQALTVAVTVGGAGGSVPTGSITLTSYNYMSPTVTLNNGAASIIIPAGTLSSGLLTITGTYTPDAASSTTYTSSSGTSTVTVTTATTPGFSLSGTAVTVKAGATSGNTSTITVTPSNGFTGSVALTASVTSGPTNASNVPTVSFGSTSPLTITGTSAATATLTVTTTAPKTSVLHMPNPFGRSSSVTLAGLSIAGSLLMFFIPRRKLRIHRLWAIAVVTTLSFAILGCGGSGNSNGGGGTSTPGTTAGAYTITVTATSGSTSSTNTVTVTVQ